MEQFAEDISNSSLTDAANTENITDLTSLYDETLLSILDQHAPLNKHFVTLRPAAPWYTDWIKMEKTERRRLEHQWCKVRSTISKQLCINQCNLINSLIYEYKMTFFFSIIEENNSNQVTLFNAVDKMLNRKAPRKLPQYHNAV